MNPSNVPDRHLECHLCGESFVFSAGEQELQRVLRELEEELAALGVDRAADVVGQAHGRTPRGLAWRA